MLANFRDAGGLRTRDGRMMRSGLLFRSEELTRATDAELARLGELGVKLICDLRSPGERPRVAAAVPMPVVKIGLHDAQTYNRNGRKVFAMLFQRDGIERLRRLCRAYYHHLAFERPEKLGDAIALLAREENLPALVHCRAGKDRTGLVIALVQLLVGVPYETVREEYLRTNECFAEKREKFIRLMRVVTLGQIPAERMRGVLLAHGELLDEVHASVLARHGSVEGYLREGCGVEEAALEALRRRLVTE